MNVASDIYGRHNLIANATVFLTLFPQWSLKAQEASTLHKELQATNDESRKNSLPWGRTHQLVSNTNGQPLEHKHRHRHTDTHIYTHAINVKVINLKKSKGVFGRIWREEGK